MPAGDFGNDFYLLHKATHPFNSRILSIDDEYGHPPIVEPTPASQIRVPFRPFPDLGRIQRMGYILKGIIPVCGYSVFQFDAINQSTQPTLMRNIYGKTVARD